jgi:hypothetical protein
MESDQVTEKQVFNRAEYSKKYQQNRYANDIEFKENKKQKVKERYYKNKELLQTLLNQFKEVSNNIV